MAVCSAPVREAATFTPTSLSSAGMWASPGPPLIVSPGILVKAGAEAGGRGEGRRVWWVCEAPTEHPVGRRARPAAFLDHLCVVVRVAGLERGRRKGRTNQEERQKRRRRLI